MYSVASFPDYGQLSGKRLADLRAGARVEVDEAKRDPLDFVLWKTVQARRAQLGIALGRGPSRLAYRMLGHVDGAAGRALRHPRRWHGPEVPAPRERDRAELRRHRQAASPTTGCTTASSTSTARRCPSRWAISSRCAMCCRTCGHPEVLRYFLVASHYRGPINYTLENLQQADATLGGLYNALRGAPVGAAACRCRCAGARSSARPWTMTSTRPRRWRCCRSWRAR